MMFDTKPSEPLPAITFSTLTSYRRASTWRRGCDVRGYQRHTIRY